MATEIASWVEARLEAVNFDHPRSRPGWRQSIISILDRGHLELLLFPRREWDAAIRASAKTMLRDLATQRAAFFRQRVQDARRESERRSATWRGS